MAPRLPMFSVAILAGAAITATSAYAIVSQGAFRIGSDALWAHGIDGSGQTVAIVDPGFSGLETSIAAGELPPLEQMEIKSFDQVNGIAGRNSLGAVTEHGTRMAEIAHDVAPGAHLVLVNYNTDDEFLQAVRWITASGIPIVSHSNSILGGPFDGTGPLARAVDEATANGVLWVNASGNFAKRHWRGVADANGVPIAITPQPNETLAFGIGWSSREVDAIVAVERQGDDGSWTEMVRSDATHRTAPITVDGGVWRVVVRQLAGPPVPLDVFSRTVTFGSAAVADGSIATPGDAAGSLTVGAVTWSDMAVADYSSRGPTQDGRQKPEIVGPTYITANPAFPGTAGTSASTPHAAAAAALIRQQRLARGQLVDVSSLRADLIGRARDIAPDGLDAASGAGMVRVDVTAPVVRISVGRGVRPLLKVRAMDNGTMESVSVRVDGRVVGKMMGPIARYRVAALAKGRHRIEVTAVDTAGNVRTTRRVVTR